MHRAPPSTFRFVLTTGLDSLRRDWFKGFLFSKFPLLGGCAHLGLSGQRDD